MDSLKFHLDENLSNSIAAGLRQRGIDVTTTPEQNLLSTDDPTQLAFARTQRRVFVTYDSDFLKLNAQGADHSGIVFLTDQRMPVGQVIQKLVVMWRTIDVLDMPGRVQFL